LNFICNAVTDKAIISHLSVLKIESHAPAVWIELSVTDVVQWSYSHQEVHRTTSRDYKEEYFSFIGETAVKFVHL